MNKMQEVIDAINAVSDKYYKVENVGKAWRSPYRQFDRVIGTVCIGCGKKLSRYENKLPYAFCFECRDVLFPETVTAKEIFQNRLDKRKF